MNQAVKAGALEVHNNPLYMICPSNINGIFHKNRKTVQFTYRFTRFVCRQCYMRCIINNPIRLNCANFFFLSRASNYTEHLLLTATILIKRTSTFVVCRAFAVSVAHS